MSLLLDTLDRAREPHPMPPPPAVDCDPERGFPSRFIGSDLYRMPEGWLKSNSRARPLYPLEIPDALNLGSLYSPIALPMPLNGHGPGRGVVLHGMLLASLLVASNLGDDPQPKQASPSKESLPETNASPSLAYHSRPKNTPNGPKGVVIQSTHRVNERFLTVERLNPVEPFSPAPQRLVVLPINHQSHGEIPGARAPEPMPHDAARAPEPAPYYAARAPEPMPYAARAPEPMPYAARAPEPAPYYAARAPEPTPYYTARAPEPAPYYAARAPEPPPYYAARAPEPMPYAARAAQPSQSAARAPEPISRTARTPETAPGSAARIPKSLPVLPQVPEIGERQPITVATLHSMPRIEERAPTSELTRSPAKPARYLFLSSQPAAASQARKALLKGDGVKAKRLYETVLRQEPHHPAALAGLAALALRDQQPERARTLYQELARVQPDSPLALAGLSALDPNSDPYALELRLKRLPIDSAEALPLQFVLATKLASNDNWTAARDGFRAALGYDANNPDLHHNLAIALEHIGDKRAALEHYREALRTRTQRGWAGFDPNRIQRRIATLQSSFSDSGSSATL
ncbi:MAG: tetratricopeptide repeat protein [Magnetococcus sp. YQC-9]